MPSLLQASHVTAFVPWARPTSKTRRATLFLFSFAVLLAGGAEAVRGQSALDGFDPNANDVPRVAVVQPDGKILIGGNFTTLSPNGGPAVARNHIARLNPDGTIDTAFNPNVNGNAGIAAIVAIAVQADGKILVGGTFTSVGGQTRYNIARLNHDGSLDSAFDANASPNDGEVFSIAVQADGKILAGGAFTTMGGQTRSNIARLNAMTGLADSFDPNANNWVRSIVIQADGNILAAGDFGSIGGQTRRRIARLDAGTGLADSFNPNADFNIFSIAVQADGKILAGGAFTSIGGEPRNGIARLDATTGLADSFDPNANDTVYSVAVQADGKILAAGSFTSIGLQTRNRIARLDNRTGLAELFDPNANSFVQSITVQADGKILAVGAFFGNNSIGGQTRNGIARMEIDGRVDQTLNPSITGFNNVVFATAAQPDGRILIGGRFTSVFGVTRNNLVRLNTDGTLDTLFDPNANGDIYSIALQADGKILAGGSFTTIAGQEHSSIARLNPDGTLDSAFNANANPNDGGVGSIAVQADGKILASGAFRTMGGQMRNNIARLDATTGLADSFDPNANSGINSSAVQADGKILAGGGFGFIGGQTRGSIARIDAMTGLADSFDPNASSTVYTIVVQPDGKILVGGNFVGANSIGGQTRNYIARLDAMTGLADSFNPVATNAVFSFALQADNKILAAGVFFGAGARVDGATGAPDLFNPRADGGANSITVQADGKILVGGGFARIGGQSRSLFARLTNDTAALQNLGVTQTTITWTRAGSSPQFMRVTFEYSNDNVNYALLGNGTATGSNWTLTGLNLPTGQNFYIRARGHYRSGFSNSSESITESVRNAFLAGPTPTPPPSPTPTSKAINLSTRMRVQTGDDVGIGGFIITGSVPKYVLLRAIGPSLANSGLVDVLADPVLEVHGPGAFATITNDNWRDRQQTVIEATGLPPTNDSESAIALMLNPGAYTTIVRGKSNTSGVALVEIYDLSQLVAAKLANISTRAFVDTGNSILIAGFVLGGKSGDDRVVLRGIGPSLTAAGVSNALADPTLELRDTNGALLIANNDWQDNPDQAGELTAAGLAPTNQLESGIAATLPPGLYTALLAGLNNGTGVGLVEVYDRGAP